MGKKKGKNKKIEKDIEETPAIVEGDVKVEETEDDAAERTESQAQIEGDEAQEIARTESAKNVDETATESEPEPGEPKAEGEEEGEAKDKKRKKEKSGKKGKKEFDPLGDERMVFKAVSFEHALTKEEKAARKAEKLRAKKEAARAAKRAAKGKGKKEASVTEVKSQEMSVGQSEAQKSAAEVTEKTSKMEEVKPAESKEKPAEAASKKKKKDKSKADTEASSKEAKEAKEKKGKKDKKKPKKEEPKEIKEAKSTTEQPTSEEGREGEPVTAKPSEPKDLPKTKSVSIREGLTTKESKVKKSKSQIEGEVPEKPSKVKKEKKKKKKDKSTTKEERPEEGEEQPEGKKKKKKKLLKKKTSSQLRTSRVMIIKSDLQYERVDETESKEKTESKMKIAKKRSKTKKKGDSVFDMSEEKELASTSYLRSRSSRLGPQSSASLLMRKKVASSIISFGSEVSVSEESAEVDIVKKSSSAVKKKGKRKGKKGKGAKVSEIMSGEIQPIEGEEAVPEEKKEAEVEEEIPKKGKKEKKGKKKGKKKKAEEEEQPPAEPVVEEVDIMEEIRRMKALAEAEVAGEGAAKVEEEAISVKKKKKKGKKKGQKKLSKKERAKLAAELAEKAKAEAEAEAARLAAEEQWRLQNEKRLGIEKEKKDTSEQQHRQEQLLKSCGFIKHLEHHNAALVKEEKEKDEWNLYIECRQLPDSSKCSLMNTYLHLWEQDIEKTTIEDAAERTRNVLQLLDELGYLIDTVTEEEMVYLENWKWVNLLFRQHQADSLDVATYRILRNIENNMNRIDIPTADFHYQDENFKLSLWLRIQLPKPLFNPRRPAQPRIEVTFSNMNLSILCPQSIEGEAMAIRAMYLSYDHLSDLCSSYEKPAVPQEYQHDLEQYTSSYWRAMLKYKYDHRVRAVKKPPEEGQENATGEGEQQQEEEQEEEEKELGPDDEIPTVPWQKLTPSASEYVLYEEDTQFLRTRQSLLTTVPAGVINLRRFLVLGGVYYVNLLFQPPQPQDFVTLDMQTTPLYLPKQLEEVPFYVEYQPPAPPEPGVRRQPEEIEEEMKKQEEEFDKQILITLTIPEHVIFLELPLVCRWDKERICWTQDDVHDVKHNEEKGYLTFRTCRFGIYTLATNRYSNFPYQAWEIKPEADLVAATPCRFK